jgi:hypothetical protein
LKGDDHVKFGGQEIYFQAPEAQVADAAQASNHKLRTMQLFSMFALA